MSSLEVRDVRHRYPDAEGPALLGASIAVPDGEMVSVVGPSGSGKSTLLRVAAGLQVATSGQVLVDGRDVTGLPAEQRDLTVVFQSPLLFEHLDVAGNVAFAPRLSGLGRREARRCAQRYLRLVHMVGLDRRHVSSLSGGQQQRVALARALAAERGALLLDEPFSSLDRELRAAMHDLLGEVRAALAPTILLVTHDLGEAALAETTAVLVDGVVHQHAPMAALYRRPASVAVARLLGGFTEVPGTVEDGVHRSAWGRVPVVDGGAAPASDASGATGATGAAALLLVRRESLRVVPAGAGSAPTGAGTEARVVRLRPDGVRTIASLAGEDGSGVEVELPADQALRHGDRVRVLLPEAAGPQWVVPGPRRAAGRQADRAPSSATSAA